MTFDELNARFAIIGVGNKIVVMELNTDGSIKEFWPFDEFKRKLIKETIKVRRTKGGKIVEETLPLADTWLRHRKGRQYDELKFVMPGSIETVGPNDYNGWQGFTVEAAKGDWSKCRAHILNVICKGNVEEFTWIQNWLAALFQFPGRHAHTAIVMHGGHGAGKGFLANNMTGNTFGQQQYLHILGSNQLTAEFNEHLSGKVFIFADESTWGGDPRAGSKLKGLITEDNVPIHRKFMKMIEEKNQMHIIIASNNEWPVQIEKGDRRFSIFHVSDVFVQNFNYFRELQKELDNGGRAAMLYDLLEYKIDTDMLRNPINNEDKANIAQSSMKPIEHWWLSVLQRGAIVADTWPDKIAKIDLHQNYLEFIDRHYKGTRERKSTETEMGVFLRKVSPVQQRVSVNGKVERIVHIPELKVCRAMFIEEFKWPTSYKWDDDLPFDKAAQTVEDLPEPPPHNDDDF
jgi:phage/plasmid-associated DNA primase